MMLDTTVTPSAMLISCQTGLFYFFTPFHGRTDLLPEQEYNVYQTLLTSGLTTQTGREVTGNRLIC